jgi:hypothetical protein
MTEAEWLAYTDPTPRSPTEGLPSVEGAKGRPSVDEDGTVGRPCHNGRHYERG